MIFEPLSLPDLARLGLVCKKWNTIRESILHGMRHFSACDATFPWEYADFYRLTFYPSLTFSPIMKKNRNAAETVQQKGDDASPRSILSPTTNFFARNAPHITELSLYGVKVTLAAFEQLLTSWTQLYELNFFPSNVDDFTYSLFCPLVKRTRSIRRLGLISFNDDIEGGQFDFSLITQLESFFFDNHFQEWYTLTEILPHIGPNTNSLGLVNVTYVPMILSQVSRYLEISEPGRQLANKLSTQIRSLTFQTDLFDDEDFNPADVPLLTFIGIFFSSLTSLDIHIHEELLFEQIVGPLSKLQELKKLRLDVVNHCFRSRLFEVPDRPRRLYLPPLGSVTCLHLSLDHSSSPTLSFYRLYMATIFGELSECHFENSGLVYRCDCKPDPLQGDSIYTGVRCRGCSEKLFTFFRNGLLNLKMVTRNRQLIYQSGDNDLVEFTSRLLQYGISPYARNSSACFPNFD